MILIFILLLAVFNMTAVHSLEEAALLSRLELNVSESAKFRAMRLGPAMAGLEWLDPDQTAALMVKHDYDLTECEDLSYDNKKLLAGKPAEYRELSEAYRTVFSDLVYFPIPESTDPETPDVTYEDGWQQPRTYGGERGHEGCDIMGGQGERGFYPVVSMSSEPLRRSAGWSREGGESGSGQSRAPTSTMPTCIPTAANGRREIR